MKEVQGAKKGVERFFSSSLATFPHTFFAFSLFSSFRLFFRNNQQQKKERKKMDNETTSARMGEGRVRVCLISLREFFFQSSLVLSTSFDFF